eukprot:1143312-Rhodomonas_salina.3
MCADEIQTRGCVIRFEAGDGVACGRDDRDGVRLELHVASTALTQLGGSRRAKQGGRRKAACSRSTPQSCTTTRCLARYWTRCRWPRERAPCTSSTRLCRCFAKLATRAPAVGAVR